MCTLTHVNVWTGFAERVENGVFQPVLEPHQLYYMLLPRNNLVGYPGSVDSC
jgi:hypothetical protein